MKRILVCFAMAAILAIPAAALGARVTYVGALDDQPASAVKLKTSSNADGDAVTSFAVRSFEVECDDGTTEVIRRSTLEGTIRIGERRGFHARDDNGESTFNVRGRIGSNRAKGTFRLSGETPAGECDSGRQAWTAD